MTIFEAFDDVELSFIDANENNVVVVTPWLGEIITETENTIKIKSNCSAYTLDEVRLVCKFDIYITICYNENDKETIEESSMQGKINLEKIKLKDFEFVLINVDYDSIILQ